MLLRLGREQLAEVVLLFGEGEAADAPRGLPALDRGPQKCSVPFAQVQNTFYLSGEETRQFVIRGEIFNMLNRANFFNPISQASPNGVTMNPQFGQILSAHDPRQIQLAIRFVW